LGCKVNQYDTDAMRKLMEAHGYVTVPFSDVADVYVINTCSVTHVSDRKSRQMISRAHAQNSDAVIIAAGCYAKTNPQAVSSLPGVNIILGTNDRASIVSVVEEYVKSKRSEVKVCKTDDTVFEDLTADESEKTRAYLKIQDGCNRFCSYCIIPYARGRIRSRTLESTKRELVKLAEHGYREVVLTGIHLMSYGADFKDGTDITDAIALTDDIRGIERVRLGSLEPEFVTDKFVRAVSEREKVCRQFHMSLQSGSDTVLMRMNRKYTTESFSAAVEKLRNAMPNCAITTDIIAGFAGETDEEHAQTLQFVEKIGFSKVHVFPYSVRSGTKAENMPDHVRPEVKEKRAHEISDAAAKSREEYMKNCIGKTERVLFEERSGDAMRGYTDTYLDVRVKTDCDFSNEIFNVHITGFDGDGLIGEICK
ncbi:MAG: tRNA (N(6)-L-threonylcarbamoyladenosine(37)-C(2))-methylthiotransferase MtaB, partial [Clostridia bacterium]|nr:tRNA (N(6)-L-threonylcarbamoyladenosine(37)-C(2))-methylthiotransferase MtaB [Clostridia bacterium]